MILADTALNLAAAVTAAPFRSLMDTKVNRVEEEDNLQNKAFGELVAGVFARQVMILLSDSASL